MQFTTYDLGYQSAGSIVQVDLEGTEANVSLLDSNNFARYRRGESHRYHGGHFRSSPVRLPIPSAGHWHVAIDLGGYAGSVRSAVRVLAA